MPDLTAKRIPSYRRHKATDQARVTLNGKTIYLGRFGTAENKNKYDQVIEEWLAQGRQVAPDGELAVSALIYSYWQHCMILLP